MTSQEISIWIGKRVFYAAAALAFLVFGTGLHGCYCEQVTKAEMEKAHRAVCARKAGDGSDYVRCVNWKVREQ